MVFLHSDVPGGGGPSAKETRPAWIRNCLPAAWASESMSLLRLSDLLASHRREAVRAPRRHRQPGYEVFPPQPGPRNHCLPLGFAWLSSAPRGAARAPRRHRQPGIYRFSPAAWASESLLFSLISLPSSVPREGGPSAKEITPAGIEIFPPQLGPQNPRYLYGSPCILASQ